MSAEVRGNVKLLGLESPENLDSRGLLSGHPVDSPGNQLKEVGL